MHAIDLDNLPSRSRIIVDEQAEGIRISWPLSKWRTSKSLNIARFIVLLVLVLGPWFFLVFAVLYPKSKPCAVFVVVALALSVLRHAHRFAIMHRQKRPQSIWLSDDTLTYDPGWSPHLAQKRELQGNLRSLRALGEKRPAVTVSRRDVHELRIEVVRAHMHLYFKLGEKRFEIGEVLSEPEREWLHTILQKWLNK
jgi:uncharacterized protein YhhL (DUF1145 family)